VKSQEHQEGAPTERVLVQIVSLLQERSWWLWTAASRPCPAYVYPQLAATCKPPDIFGHAMEIQAACECFRRPRALAGLHAALRITSVLAAMAPHGTRFDANQCRDAIASACGKQEENDWPCERAMPCPLPVTQEARGTLHDTDVEDVAAAMRKVLEMHAVGARVKQLCAAVCA
jgi:hypothetical protein